MIFRRSIGETVKNLEALSRRHNSGFTINGQTLEVSTGTNTIENVEDLVEEITNDPFSEVDNNEYSIIPSTRDPNIVAIVDKSLNFNSRTRREKNKLPLLASPEIVEVVKDIQNQTQDKKQRSQLIYEWTIRNIQYDRRKNIRRYFPGMRERNSLETFRERIGLCGEMSYLYTVMTRIAGIRGNLVDVSRDNSGKRVRHACARVDLPGKYHKTTLIDPAYQIYDVNHAECKTITDSDLIKWF